ncbi:MAG TPA: acyltransferase family protein, partial [Turneriella sp.]|nr:acyltransferase family protein [Turneriella sp.]
MLRTTTDWAKVIAALAVVGIHSTSSAETNFALQHNYASLDFLGVLVNQWARFSVPLFIYLSAYGLSRSTKIGESGFGGNYAAFVKKRLPTILVPYFFFSGIAIAMEFHSWMSATGQSSFSPQLWKNIAS